MISWRGVPDFSQQLEISGFTVHPAGDEAGLFVYLPGQLVLASVEGTGKPDFSLEAVRGANPFKPPQPYGVLDFRVGPAPFTEEALATLRQERPGAAVAPPLFHRGWLRLVRLGQQEASADLQNPMPLASNGLDVTRQIRRLNPDELSLMRQVLQDATLTCSAVAEMEVYGLTARHTARLDFAPPALLAALGQSADGQGRMSLEEVVKFWLQDLASLPVTPLEGFNGGEPAVWARILADWTMADLADYIASPAAPVRPTCQLRRPENLPSLVRWDLAQKKLVPQLITLQLDPFTEAQKLAAAEGEASVFHETIVPPLETGVVSLTVAVNLPEALQGVLRLGVTLLAPPRPPERVTPLTAALLFDDPAVRQTVNWRFSPVEEVAYQYTTFVMLKGPGGAPRRLNGAATMHKGTYLLLSVADFPLGFVPIQAGARLLELAVVKGVCRYHNPQDGGLVELSFELNTGRPQVTLVLPEAALPGASVRVEAVSRQDRKTLSLGEHPAKGLSLDLFSLREYGPQTVQLSVEFDTPLPLVALELLPLTETDRPEGATVIAFTPDKPEAIWHYMAASPFQPEYVFRHYGGTGSGGPPPSWSAPRSPFETLHLKTSEI